MEMEKGYGTISWRYTYDLMGNRTLVEKKNPRGEVEESNQLSEAVLCNGTRIKLMVNGEVSPTGEELIKLITPAGATLTSKYELIEYVNEVNRQSVEI